MAKPIIVIDGISKKFVNNLALDGISAAIKPGFITGILGPDGSGKTTLLRHVAGLMSPNAGKIFIFGQNIDKNSHLLGDKIGYMPQQFGLYEDLSVLENLKLYANLKGLPAAQQPAIFAHLLQLTMLNQFQDRLVGHLSGGMKQKLALACALITRPPILLLDEPGVGVDPIARRDLWALAQQLAQAGTTILWATAYLDEAAQCDEILILDKGRLIYSGAPQSLIHRVKNRVFQISGTMPKRQLLQKLSSFDAIEDINIQGHLIRILLKNANALQGIIHAFFGTIIATVTSAHFGDAYIDLLGGIKNRISPIAGALNEAAAYDGPIIEAEQLSKNFGSFKAAQNISFTIKRGEIFGLLGPNGAGKSTTFKMLCGLLKPSAGKGFVVGYDLRKHGSKARNHIGYMAQKFSLYKDLDVEQNLNFYAGIYGLDKKAARKQRELMLDVFSLSDYRKQIAGSLPPGLRQRLSLAACLMHQPQALFLDEPTSGVDPLTRREFWNHINGIAEKGISVLVTTHFMEEAEYCDRIALIYEGRTIALGAPHELKRQIATKTLPNPSMEDTFIALILASSDQKGLRND
ncbi:ATP-binding cassette domain-containing protein [Bartonella sp. HY329]|uniref:ATP-binding cassette domain-containing protein n=1 Tax=unclassified Bartonella TaxID=2645622 RepID=UPI0021C7C905|nr:MULTISPECIES: ATP-binding cassette domain-containing protein [unclassified Bartonella]UXM94882.1 ATP-binding cassette domain-containing protein [Bartonella sp. HY329]UXN09205.1 ATP-binding cassette domain-containing protein [Bartonella sp. HY328]